MGLPVPLVIEEIAEVTQHVPFERIQTPVRKQTVASRVPQIKEEGVHDVRTPWTLCNSYHWKALRIAQRRSRITQKS